MLKKDGIATFIPGFNGLHCYDAKQKANKEARKIIIQTIQRTAAEQAIENTITVFIWLRSNKLD